MRWLSTANASGRMSPKLNRCLTQACYRKAAWSVPTRTWLASAVGPFRSRRTAARRWSRRQLPNSHTAGPGRWPARAYDRARGRGRCDRPCPVSQPRTRAWSGGCGGYPLRRGQGPACAHKHVVMTVAGAPQARVQCRWYAVTLCAVGRQPTALSHTFGAGTQPQCGSGSHVLRRSCSGRVTCHTCRVPHESAGTAPIVLCL